MDAYQVLGISRNATADQIRGAYLEKAYQSHPCKLSDQPHGDPRTQQSRFRLAAEAMTLLGDESRRRMYDVAITVHESVTEQPVTDRGDLRTALPPGMRSLLEKLDPIRVFNRVTFELDEERQQHLRGDTDAPHRPGPGSNSSNGHSAPTQAPAGRMGREEGEGPHLQTHIGRQRRAESTSQRDSPLSDGSQTPSSCLSANARPKSRRVSFTNDTIASDELKQAREAVKALKAEAGRIAASAVADGSHNSSHRATSVERRRGGMSPHISSPSGLYSEHGLYDTTDRRNQRHFEIPSPGKEGASWAGADPTQPWSCSAPTGFLEEMRAGACSGSEVAPNGTFPWSAMDFDDPRTLAPVKRRGRGQSCRSTDPPTLEGSPDLRHTPRPVSITYTATETMGMGRNKRQAHLEMIMYGREEACERREYGEEARRAVDELAEFLAELDGYDGAFDWRMAEALYRGGVKKKEWLIEMSAEELRLVMKRIEESKTRRGGEDGEGVPRLVAGMGTAETGLASGRAGSGERGGLTPFQEATLPRRLEDWKFKQNQAKFNPLSIRRHQ